MSDLSEAYFVSPAIDIEEGSSDEKEGDFDEPREPPPPPAGADSQHDDLSLGLPSEDEEVVDALLPPVTVLAVLPDGTGDMDDQLREIGDLGHQAASADVAMAQVARFSCKCKYFNGGPCYMRYTSEEIMFSGDN